MVALLIGILLGKIKTLIFTVNICLTPHQAKPSPLFRAKLMSFIPAKALKFGAERLSNFPVSYGKSRVSQSTQTTYYLHIRGGCMPGQKDLFTTTSLSRPNPDASINNNRVISAFNLKNYLHTKPLTGPKYNRDSINNFTYQEFSPIDDEALIVAINAAYRQVYGNFNAMESERPIELERRLRNGDIVIKDFIRGLAKSSFYKLHYFESVSQQRCIELNFKHILGRPTLGQDEIARNIELFASKGFNGHIDSLIDSLEYEENFGSNIVPFQRCWNSPCGVKTSSFIHTALLTKGFATSDNTIKMKSKDMTIPSDSSQFKVS